MLQQFYKETLQSQYIKYLLNTNYIPTVPFTSNISHITNGNTYIHNGYFVTAKRSDAIAAIEEDIKRNPSEYYNNFIKHEPYIFGRQYKGLTTNYKSSTKGYDSTLHYYLGEYLRAYKAYYNIDLMPFYNCFSNEYVDYLNLKSINGNVELIQSTNKKYTVISVPIKFCQKYSIALQCPNEVLMLPVFIGNKGLLKDLTSNLHKLEYWGKSLPLSNFQTPFIYESPHINSVSDATQAALQNYDKYLRLLIQIPANIKTSIVVLEGEYSNSKNFSTKFINTSKTDVLDIWREYYDTKIPSSDYINIPDNSQLICKDISRQKVYSTIDNDIAYIKDSQQNIIETFKFQVNGYSIDSNISNLTNRFIKSSLPYSVEINNNGTYYILELNQLCVDNGIGANINNNKKYNIYTYEPSEQPKEYTNNSILEVPSSVLNSILDGKKYEFLAWTLSKTLSNNEKIRAIVAYKINGNIEFYFYEFAFYLKEEDLNSLVSLIFDQKIQDNYEWEEEISNNQIKINLNFANKANLYIQLNQNLTLESQNAWELKSEIPINQNKFTKYLNKYMISDLSLLRFNDGISYGFCDRLIEYLTNAVITSAEPISNNIKRVQSAIIKKQEEEPLKDLTLTTDISNGIWDDSLRVDVYNYTNYKRQNREQNLLYDINGFVDKDSEKTLVISNEL